MMPARILVFAKAPIPGRVKTRLIPALGAFGAARLSRIMLKHTLDQALSSGVGPVELCAGPAVEHADWHDCTLPPGVETSGQGEGDLGERMARAARRGLSRNERVLLIGSDSPGLSARHLRAAATALDGHDAAIHPALDGGYALLGIRIFHPALFTDIAWSTSGVADVTLERMRLLQWRIWVGDVLPDIDEPADLIYLPSQLKAEMQTLFTRDLS